MEDQRQGPSDIIKPTFEKKVDTLSIPNFERVRNSEDILRAQNLKLTVGETIGLHTEWLFCVTVAKRLDNNKSPSGIGVALKLTKCAAGPTRVKMSFLVKVKSNNGSSDYKSLVQIDRLAALTGVRINEVISNDAALTDLPLVDGCLIMEIELTLYTEAGSRDPAVFTDAKRYFVVAGPWQQIFLKTLQSDMAKALSSPSSKSNADTKIITSDDEEFSVIRGILSARSAVFETMFQSEMSESQTGEARVTDISSETMKVLLHFLYTGTLIDGWWGEDVIVGLVYAAGKYQLHDLLQFLDQALGTVCSKKNVGKLANLARKLSLKRAEQDLFEYMKCATSNLEEMIQYFKGII